MSAATDTGTVTTRPPVFIALQANNDTIPIVEAI